MNLKLKNWPKRMISCKICGRVDVHVRPDGALSKRRVPFHYAPCGRPCVGGSPEKLRAEDRADGMHERECEFCEKEKR